MERWYYTNKQCSWSKYIEISDILQALLIMVLNQKFSKFEKKLASQSTLAWLSIATAYPPKTCQKKSSEN